jgi:uncharacterized membrane protein YjgN (DUF898 family)
MGVLKYHGDGKSLFKIYIINVLLTIVTVGLYYPWAKAKLLTYHYAETELQGSRFAFLGTGKEIFRGFIKAIAIFGTWYGVSYYLTLQMQTGEDVLFFTIMVAAWKLVIMLIFPLAIVGSLKYRLSRTTWRGIHMKYTGNVKAMYKIFIKGILLSIITLGIYGPWFMVNIRKEVLKNVKLGDLNFKFTGEGGALFGIGIAGYLLTIITFGIYLFQWTANLYNFDIDNIKLNRGEENASLKGSTTGMGFFKLQIGNLFIVLLSLGLAAPYAMIRTLKYYTNSVDLNGEINFDKIKQVEIDDADATGDSILDAFEMDIV